MSSCCGACGGQNTDKAKKEEDQKKQDEKKSD